MLFMNFCCLKSLLVRQNIDILPPPLLNFDYFYAVIEKEFCDLLNDCVRGVGPEANTIFLILKGNNNEISIVENPAFKQKRKERLIGLWVEVEVNNVSGKMRGILLSAEKNSIVLASEHWLNPNDETTQKFRVLNANNIYSITKMHGILANQQRNPIEDLLRSLPAQESVEQ